MEQLLPKNQIYLDVEVYKEYPTVALDEDGYSLNFRQLKKLNPLCYHCGDRKLSYEHFNFWYRCASFKHFYCYDCCDYSLKKFTHTCVGGEPIFEEGETSVLFLCATIKLECKWEGCKKFFCGSNLKKHELSCQKQPKRECPVKDCSWSGRIDEMERDHFKKEHVDGKMILRNVVWQLESNKTYYLLILGKFVKVEYLVEELGEVYAHNVDLEVCKESLSGVKPVGLVSVKYTLLKKINGSGNFKSIRNNVVLFVYFEDE